VFGFKRRRRERLRRQPFPEGWREVLRENVPYYRRLPPADRREFEGHVQVFLAEKHFEGCGGMQLTDEVRVTIAGHACILLLHRETDYYPRLASILVYPHEFQAERLRPGPTGHFLEETEVLAGESWPEGVVVLSWDDVLEAARGESDGCNVVLHEFAHQLDQGRGAGDASPVLADRAAFASWARVLGDEYDQLLDDLDDDRDTLIDEYGATDPAEFFAVITETFFEQPVELKRDHPRLYKALRLFYQQDPAALMAR
jgi:Mlc titration factor MtfA (ptsG expression regulator)